VDKAKRHYRATSKILLDVIKRVPEVPYWKLQGSTVTIIPHVSIIGSPLHKNVHVTVKSRALSKTINVDSFSFLVDCPLSLFFRREY
ncbi:MAG: hypothetical protein ACFFFG_18640, partial [Candidatus Thorarchaeota archaeon]